MQTDVICSSIQLMNKSIPYRLVSPRVYNKANTEEIKQYNLIANTTYRLHGQLTKWLAVHEHLQNQSRRSETMVDYDKTNPMTPQKGEGIITFV